MLRIKVLRLSKGLSQLALSLAAEISQGRYSYLERGVLSPTVDERERLATILHAPAATLFRLAVRERRAPASVDISRSGQEG